MILNNNFGTINKGTILLREDVRDDAELVIVKEFLPTCEKNIPHSAKLLITTEVIKKGTEHKWSNGTITVGERYIALKKNNLQKYKTKSGIECYEVASENGTYIQPIITEKDLFALLKKNCY